MAETAIGESTQRTPVLDRTINLANVSWVTIGWVIVFFTAIALRIPQLGHHALSAGEAHLADDAYRFFYGETAGPGNEISNTGPTALLFEALSLFLFGATDTAARIAPALLGIAMIGMVFGLRPILGSARALGAGALLALSPTVVYISRIATDEIFVAAFSLFTVMALSRIGSTESVEVRRRWALLLGIGLAALFGSGPSSLSVLIALALGIAASCVLESSRSSTFLVAAKAFNSTPQAAFYAAIGFGITLLTLFSHFYSDFSALAGIGETFADWARLLTTASTSTPTQFFLLAVLLYEILAVVFAIVAVFKTPAADEPGYPWTMFAVWFSAALLMFSFSSGSEPIHAIHVALPLVILGGAALGELIERLTFRQILSGRTGLMMLAMLGFVIALFAMLVLLGRIDTAFDQGQAVFEAIATFVLALLPLGFAIYAIARSERLAGRPAQLGSVALLTIAVILGGFTIRTSVMLSYFNSDEAVELLAQETSTPAVHQIVKRVTNLGRDTTLDDGSARDPEGGHALTIAIDRTIQWPYRWYFRDFPDAIVVAEGQAPLTGAQVVIAPDDSGMADSGYAPREFPTENRVPASYLSPDFGDILKSVFYPNEWEDSFRYLLFRTIQTPVEPESVTLGLEGELANKVTPNSGPFSLYEQVGAGNGLGQFNQPRGIAVSEDGEQIYVVDMANARVNHYDATGEYVDEWGGANEESGLQFGKTDSGLGPTGIATGPDGLIYITDTWNHKVVVVDGSGRLIREFGEYADTVDAPDASVETGKFFGPRSIAIANNEIFVVDTGNERVQVFDLDGTFIRSFGGFGTEPGQFVEPVGIAIDANGQVYVADSGNARISIFSSTGVPIDQWPVEAWAGNLYFEPYLAFDDQGLLYASSSATGSVEVFDQSGALVLSIRRVDTEQLEQPVGVAWTPEGSLLISDKGRNAVFRYTPLQIAPEEDTSGEIGDSVNNQPASPIASPEASPILSSETLLKGSPVASPQASPIGSPVASPEASPTLAGNG